MASNPNLASPQLDDQGLLGLLTGPKSEAILPVGIIGTVLIMVVPVPPWLMDLLLATSIMISLLILFVGIYTLRPLDFSVFPSLLLVVTLLRLALNVASTRLILLHGNEGSAAAGNLIAAFASFVIGGNYVVGLIIFFILVVINFVVITKGAGRIAEVSARFTLDAMPGKQMSIDADLNAGLIDENQARSRRQSIEQEADFYGAMDGASKFVRGDAVAGIIILLINLLGGLVIGVTQHGLSLAEAARIYMLLTVGDGLVSQIPALIVSTAAGLIVTRAASESNLSSTIAQQLTRHANALVIASAMLIIMGVMPGMPLIPFWTLGFLVGGAAWISNADNNRKLIQAREDAEQDAHAEQSASEEPDALLPLDLVSLEVGYRLISMVDVDQNGDLLERIRSLRRQFAQQWGFVVPPVRIRDNLELKPSVYSILIKGCEVASGELMTGHLLAMASGDEDLSTLPGSPTVEPAFNLPAQWIPESAREKAQALGFTVVDASTVVATHLTEVLKSHLHELLTRQETQNLVDSLGKKFPKVIEGVVPEIVGLGVLQRVLQHLLAERVSIRDLLTIIETLSEKVSGTTDPDLLTESVRQALARHITRQYIGEDGKLVVMMLERQMEDQIIRSTQRSEQGYLISLDPAIAQEMIVAIERAIDRWEAAQTTPIIACLPACRGPLRKLTEKFFPNLVILSHNEIASNVIVESVGIVEKAHAAA
ncbi:flagellar biosynthesis protein FlhA [Candidatus Sumerlaeota bacterium]|nr:flagellar biosynthesis protein FlhA [Candidatus Sumerlaeota bacterium]